MSKKKITQLNRLNDVFFKALLGSEERKALTLNFINAILHREGDQIFTNLIFASQELIPPRDKGKRCQVDVIAQMNDKSRVHIEVQVIADLCMANRTLYYWCHLYGRELESGEPYQHLRPVITIDLLNYNQFKEYEDYAHSYHIANDRTHDILTDHLEIHFIELKKIHISDIKQMKRGERWLAYFSPNYSDKEREVLAMSDNAIKEAMQYEKKFESDNKLISAYWDYEKSLRDYNSDVLGNKQLGFNEGTDALSELIQILLKEKRLDEVDRVTKDKEYRKKMLEEYHLL